jgi:cyclic pyranopterin phosphate synthase
MSHDEAKPARLTHLDEAGAARMVDVSGKGVTLREASASAAVHMASGVLDALLGGTLPKGDALATARIAGIQAAKRTAEWIPLCHVLPLDWVQIDFERSRRDELHITCTARTTARTGVEMEALVGASAAALTVYDMAKALDKSMVIGPIQLERKTGGKSGSFRRGE